MPILPISDLRIGLTLVLIAICVCVCVRGPDNDRVVQMVRQWVMCSRRLQRAEVRRTRRILLNPHRQLRLTTRCILQRRRRHRTRWPPGRRLPDTRLTDIIPSLVSHRHSSSSSSHCHAFRIWTPSHRG